MKIYKVTEARSYYVLAEEEQAATALVVAGNVATAHAVDHTTKVAVRVPAELHGLALKTAGAFATDQLEALGKLLGREPTIADWLDIERRRAGSAPKVDPTTPKDDAS